MKKYYDTPELDITKFEVEEELLDGENPSQGAGDHWGNTVHDDLTGSDPDETADNPKPPWEW